MRTFYLLLWAVCVLALMVIITSSMSYFFQALFICIVLSLTYWESRFFFIKDIVLRDNKILLTDIKGSHITNFLPSSVMGRYLCFLHLSESSSGKRWYVPVSRLEFSRNDFRRLKCVLQGFSMRTN